MYECFYFSSSSLIQWAASRFKDATFVTYEQVHPDDGFGIVMQKHFENMKSPLLSLIKFPDLESQEHRYVSRVCMVLYSPNSVQAYGSIVHPPPGDI
jgi:tRNA wybutosine-synthesizing protein 4